MVEVIHAVQRWRWTAAEKTRMVEESSQPGMSVSYVDHRHGVAYLAGTQYFRR
jgi:transposase